MSCRGWYPDPTGRFAARYWAGRWTDVVANGPELYRDPVRSARRTNWALALLAQLVVCSLALPVAAFMLIGGDDFPRSRSGLTRDVAGRIQILSVSCPGERIRSIELRRLVTTPEDKPEWRQIWAISGDAPVPPKVTLGARLAGLQTTRPMRVQDLTGRLQVMVETDKLQIPSPLDFRPREVRADVLYYDTRLSDRTEFQRAAFASTPCQRPGGDPWRVHFAVLVLLGALSFLLAAVGGAMLIWPRLGTPDPSTALSA